MLPNPSFCQHERRRAKTYLELISTMSNTVYKCNKTKKYNAGMLRKKIYVCVFLLEKISFLWLSILCYLCCTFVLMQKTSSLFSRSFLYYF